jgi:ABC-type nitrate/sulfonate/bicarbonate transport system substrate-binding protein
LIGQEKATVQGFVNAIDRAMHWVKSHDPQPYSIDRFFWEDPARR